MNRKRSGGLRPRWTRTSFASALLIATAAAFASPSFAAQTDATTSATFLKLPVGARNAALGATGAAEASVYSLYWNPAGLAAVEGAELAYSYSSWLANTSYQFLGYAQKTSVGTFGVSAQYLNVPGIQEYDNTGAPLSGQYRPFDGLVSAAYARQVGFVSVGVDVKAIYSKLQERTAQTVAADVGARVDSLFGRKLSAGLTLQNAGPGLKYDQDRAPLPLNVKGGLAYSPYAGLTLCLDLNKSRGADPWLGAGVEYLLVTSPGVFIGPRAGYETDRMDLGGFAGMTMGFGLVLHKLSFDYAFVPMGDFGDTHRLSLKVAFR